MTAQVSDTLIFEGTEFSIAAIEKKWPFKPQDHGFEPVGMSTACWRGYYCVYNVNQGGLVLERLNLGCGENKPPNWKGIQPRRGEFFKYNNMWEYINVSLPIGYSGGIIIGYDFIRDFYVHMGFHRPHCYRLVKELIFDDGRLVKNIDHSEKMGQTRQMIESASKSSSEDTRTRKEIEQFVEDAFSMSYDKKWA